MPDIVSTILAKALVMLLQALLTRVALYLIRTGMYKQLVTA
ncbi:hypothetical protein [Actinoallomurus sp. NPDC050550]